MLLVLYPPATTYPINIEIVSFFSRSFCQVLPLISVIIKTVAGFLEVVVIQIHTIVYDLVTFTPVSFTICNTHLPIKRKIVWLSRNYTKRFRSLLSLMHNTKEHV